MNNEDIERLRKTTIAFLKDFADKGYENAVECIDWLERKGEQKFDKDELKFNVGDVVINKKTKDTVKIVQILHDSYCYSGWDGAATVHGDFSISEQDDWELVEQNPAKQPHNSCELEEEIEEWVGHEAFPEGTDITPLQKLWK